MDPFLHMFVMHLHNRVRVINHTYKTAESQLNALADLTNLGHDPMR